MQTLRMTDTHGKRIREGIFRQIYDANNKANPGYNNGYTIVTNCSIMSCKS